MKSQEKNKYRQREIKGFVFDSLNMLTVWSLLIGGFSISIFALWLSDDFDTWPKIFSAFLEKLGLTLIVMGITSVILVAFRKRIEALFNYKTDELDHKHILKEQQREYLEGIKKTGIRAIYKDRGTSDKSYRNDLKNYLSETKSGETIKIVGVTLARFFGPNYDKEILSIFFDLLRRDIQFELLILDPRSEAARRRALTDQGELVETHGYVSSTILKDLLTVIRKLKEPTPDWCIDQNIKERIISQINIRMYETNPVSHLIISDKYIFIEQYHNGGGEYLREVLSKTNKYSNLPNYTGFIPVFRVLKYSLYGQLMISHFDNMWKSQYCIDNDIRSGKTYESIFDYNVKEWIRRGLVVDAEEE